MRLTASERQRLDERARDPKAFDQREREAEAERVVDRRLWAAVMLTADLGVSRTIGRGEPVLCRQLDSVALRRALRGGSLPPSGSYIAITPEMLDAVVEAGAFVPMKARKR